MYSIVITQSNNKVEIRRMETNEDYADRLLCGSGQPVVPRFHKKRKEKLVKFIDEHGQKYTGILINNCREYPSDRRKYENWELIGTIAGSSQRFVWAVLRSAPGIIRKQL